MTSALARAAARAGLLESAGDSQDTPKKRRGPAPKPRDEVRCYTVSVRMNDAELAALDAQRAAAGGIERGAQLRQAWAGHAPEVRIPEANRLAYAALARSSANLTQVAAHLTMAKGYGETVRAVNDVAGRLETFRTSLLTPLTAGGEVSESLAERVAEAAGRHERRLRRGPYKLPEGERRDNVVAVRLSADELDQLDAQRKAGQAKRGEWLRMTWQALTPKERIPAISSTAYDALARSADNLNRIAKYLNEGGEVKGRVPIIDEELQAFERNMRRAESSKE